MNEQELVELFNNIIANNTIKPVEFRLYYDANGDPIFYACEDLPGDYIVVDKDVYAQGRYDLKVVDNEIVFLKDFVYYNKIAPAESGTPTDPKNALIIDQTSTTRWNLKTYRAE